MRILILILLFALTFAENCVFFQNTFVSSSLIGNHSIYFEITSRGRSGWTAIGWGNTSNHLDSTMILFYYGRERQDDRYVFFDNHQTFRNVTLKNAEFWRDPQSTFDGRMVFSFEIEKSRLKTPKVTFFARDYRRVESLDRIRGHPRNLCGYKEIPIIENSGSCFVPQSARIDAFSAPSFIAVIFFDIICIFFMIAFRNTRPFASRSIGPFIAIACHIVNLLTSHFLSQASYELRNSQGCYFWLVGSILSIQVSFVIPLVVYIRAFIIINLKEYKSGMSESKRYMFLYRLTSPWVMVIIFLSYLAYLVVSSVIVFAVTGFTCQDVTKSSFYTKFLIEAWIVGFLILGLQGYDFYMNRKILCNWKKLFITEDPHFFRFEMLMFTTMIILYTLWYVIDSIIIQFEYISVFMTLIVNSIFSWWLFFIQVSFALTMAMLLKIGDVCVKRAQVNHHLIHDILENEKLLEDFSKFLQKEWVIENLLSKLDIAKYKKNPSITSARNFVETYIESDSYALNLDKSSTHSLMKRLNEGLVDSQLFNEIENEIDLNLLDSISRYTQTEFFLNYHNLAQFKEKFMTNDTI